MKYYYPQHLNGYAQIKAEGKTAWAEIHGWSGFENFCSRPFLEAVLPELHFAAPAPEVLVYGCGTGPEACFLAERGFRVDGIDLVPDAIELAKKQAADRGLDIRYAVQDICELPHAGKQYDMIIDSFCLQCIAFDTERQRLFSAVRARLKPDGYYLISTAILDTEHQAMVEGGETVTDNATGTVYTRYMGDGLIDTQSGFVVIPLAEDPSEYPEAVQINSHWYLPHRKHLTPAQLEAELWEAGFRVVYREFDHAGCMACTIRK